MTTTAALPGRLLNLGCGARFHPAWVNLDLHPQHPGVRRHDVTGRLPFPDGAFRGVYHSHLLEHLPSAIVPSFLGECHRVLAPGGVLRLAVPDLEQIARLYLAALERATTGDPAASAEHRWLVMELFDQATRERPGGAMLDYLATGAVELAWYRLGADGTPIRRHVERTAAPPSRPSGWQRWRGRLLGGWRERLTRWLLGAEYPLLQLGRFRRGGEVHQWMYDRVSLRTLLIAAGFVVVRCVGPTESALPGWADYGLDAAPGGPAHKPDSLYVEARKP